MVFKLTVVLMSIFSCCLAALYRKEVLNATRRSAVCNDGTTAIFYIEKTTSSKWVIFLESGGACFDYNSCSSRMTKEPYLFGTSKYPMKIIGEDLLSSNPEKNFAFDFNKVLVPYCSSDLWLGNKSITMESKNKRLKISFRGYNIFNSVIEDLEMYGLRNASQILLAGSSAGGIGVLNQAKNMRNNYRATISVLTDSSWFINYKNMLSAKNIQAFVNGIGADSIKSCADLSFDHPCCLSTLCMIRRNFFTSDIQLFALISRHDIYALSKGIFIPETLIGPSKTNKIISDMLSFSGEITHSVRLVKTFRNVHTIVTSCFQHTFLASSSLWLPGGIFYARSQTSLNFPLFVFHHSVRKERWNQVFVQSQTIQKILAAWYEYFVVSRASHTSNFYGNASSHQGSVSDSCRGIQCNPSCPKSITFQSKTTTWPKWSQWTLLLLYLLLTLACLSVKVFWIVKRVRENGIQNDFVTSLYNGSKVLNAIGLPCCIPSNYIGLCCIDVRYSVVNETPTRMVAQEEKTPKKAMFSGLRKPSGAVSVERRDILKGVNAYFNPGQLIAVMGPSGSGKTTFLDILTGRRNTEDPKAKVLINGMSSNETSEWFKRHSGYVLQLATPYHEELTVRENLTFSALMRLPKTMSTKNKLWRVEQVIGQAGLNDYADVVVGSATGPGLSGGQKRRLCVAIQLLRVPSVLFLDEPTSGLDSASSLELLETLHGLTLSGRLVILTIHQPRIEIFHMFDRILFLCDGKVAFFGSPLMAPTMIAEALKNTGEVFDASNPADTIMDVLINKKSQELIVDFYNKSGEIEAIKEGIMTASQNPIKTLSMKVKRYPSSLADRLLAFDCRASKCQTRAQKLYLLLIFLLYGIALGSVYLQTDSAVLLMSCYQVFTCASQLFMASVIQAHFNKAMTVFSLEQAEGVGKSYELIIHSFIRIAALSFVPLLLCSAIIYLCTVVHLDFWKFFVTTIIHVQLNHVWIALITLFVCICPRYSTLICPMLSAVSGFAGGFLVPKPKMPLLYYWLFYINPTHWAYSAIMKVLISDVIFDCASGSILECKANMGIAVLKQFGLDKVEPFENMVILFAMLFILLGLSMLLVEMKYTNKFQKMKVAIRNVARNIAERISKTTDCCRPSSLRKDEELRILISKKDIEANGNCLSPATFMSSFSEHSIKCSNNNSTETRGSQREDNIISSMLPIKVHPMLTARLVQKTRPNTISVFPGEETKHAVVSRSNTITYTERPARWNDSLKQEKPLPLEQLVGNGAKVPRIVVVDASETADFEGRQRSESTDSYIFLSRYLDIAMKPHEVYCSASKNRARKTRRKSVVRRMPDEVKRSESVHIQRKASMLILAEKRKSMTAQITGFGHVFTYANELSDEPRKPNPQRKNATCGIKRKIETKKHQKEAILNTKCDSMDHLSVPDPDEEQLKENIARPVARRSIIRSQKAFDFSDDSGNEDKPTGPTELHVPKIQYSKPSILVNSKTRTSSVASDGNPNNRPGLSEPFVAPKTPVNESRFINKNRRMLHGGEESKELVKVSALKISRKRLIPTKPNNEDNPKFSDRYDSDARSVTCRSSLGSIDELDEDEEGDNSSLDDDLETFKPRVRIRRSSLQQAQRNTALSKDFSEVTNWLLQNSLDNEASKTPHDCTSETTASDGFEAIYYDKVKVCSPLLEVDSVNVNTSILKSPNSPKNTPTPKTFSNAVYMIESPFHSTNIKTERSDINHELESIRVDSIDVNNEKTMATRSNEELTSLGNKEFSNERFDDSKKNLSSAKHASLRKSNSFEFDLDKFEKQEKGDIVKTRSMRREKKKLKFDKLGPNNDTENNRRHYELLNETVI